MRRKRSAAAERLRFREEEGVAKNTAQVGMNFLDQVLFAAFPFRIAGLPPSNECGALQRCSHCTCAVNTRSACVSIVSVQRHMGKAQCGCARMCLGARGAELRGGTNVRVRARYTPRPLLRVRTLWDSA
jgi:hypothetical protein